MARGVQKNTSHSPGNSGKTLTRKKIQYGQKRKNIAEGCLQGIRNPEQSQIDRRPEKRRRIRAYPSS